LPTGTVTFLFTDLEGSTVLLEAHPAAYRAAVRRHHDLLRGAVEAHGGVVFETVGDAVYAAFARPSDAAAAALAGQCALQGEPWGETGPLRVRMGVHLGEVERQGGHYFGAPLYRCARLMATAHGGQTVLSAAAAELVRGALPVGASLRDLGEHRLKDLATPEHVFQLGHCGLPAEFPPLRTLDARPHNLPLQLNSFLGRERELAEVARLLGTARLLTLTGSGGTGKTRLALQAAAAALDAYPDGVWLVELAALADPALVPRAAAAAVGVREEPGRPLLATLVDALRPRRLLLVLDNCEHLLDACARLAEALLRACPDLRLLVTSRAALRLAGEHEFPVPPLTLPPRRAAAGERSPDPAALARAEAVALFVERARAGAPAFALTAENGAAVAEICRRLDGLPLAVELAAARVKLLPPAVLLARLGRRLALLRGGPRDAPARHQTLRATLDWSHALLDADARRLFARLAVFVGGCTLEAAEAVCAPPGVPALDVLEGLAALAEGSLVPPAGQTGRAGAAGDPGASEAPPAGARFVLLETVREYAAERLAAGGEHLPLRRAHAEYFGALAREAESGLRGAEQAAWLDRLEADHDNLREALRWWTEQAAAGDLRSAAAGLELAGALWRFWQVRGYLSEGWRRLGELLELTAPLAAGAPGPPGPVAPGDPGAPAAPAALSRRYRAARAEAAFGASVLAGYLGDGAPGRALMEESLALWRAAGDEEGVAWALQNLGMFDISSGDFAAARTHLAQSAALFRRHRHPAGLAWALMATGLGRIEQGDAPAARAALEESVALFREVGDRRGLALALAWRGTAAAEQGQDAAARADYREGLAIMRTLGGRPDLIWMLEGCAGLAATGGRPHVAARLSGAAAAARETVGLGSYIGPRARLDRRLVAVRTALGATAFAEAWAAGQAMPLEQAVAAALEDAPDSP
jgi:predicted ATPase/class 3 adenylate cyclase